MHLYRIARKKYIRDLSGEGARLFGGRWNPKGLPVVYTSTHESLAALETLVHSPISNLPDDLQIAILKLPDNFPVHFISKETLPDNWSQFPAPSTLKDMGRTWWESGKYPALKVPSAVITSEWNILLNPIHDQLKEIKIDEVRPFTFDPRLPL